MVRVSSSVASRKRRKRILKAVKGHVGDRKNHIRLATEGVMRALAFNYRHRKHNKTLFRQLWITRVGAAAKMCGLSYSRLIDGLNKAGCQINRKMLADLAVRNPEAFSAVAETAKGALA
ncbi:MAG: 50S ribosomal protein L20 [Parachlamydiales bacterium]